MGIGWQISLMSVLSIVGLLSAPMAYIVYVFVQNRCGDVVEVQQQFHVEFSSDEEGEDDFRIADSDRRTTMRWSNATVNLERASIATTALDGSFAQSFAHCDSTVELEARTKSTPRG